MTFGFHEQTNLLLSILYYHRRRALVAFGFCTGYWVLLQMTKNHWSESLRMGMAGSLANVICDSTFHLVDTVNIRSKVHDKCNRKLSTYD